MTKRQLRAEIEELRAAQALCVCGCGEEPHVLREEPKPVIAFNEINHLRLKTAMVALAAFVFISMPGPMLDGILIRVVQ